MSLRSPVKVDEAASAHSSQRASGGVVRRYVKRARLQATVSLGVISQPAPEDQACKSQIDLNQLRDCR